jgi:hypothetical protein
VQCSAVQSSPVQYSTVQYSTVQYSTVTKPLQISAEPITKIMLLQTSVQYVSCCSPISVG